MAGVRKLLDEGFVDQDEEIDCITAGKGLRDRKAVALSTERTTKAELTRESVMTMLTQRSSVQR
jgi:hypothetical protein